MEKRTRIIIVGIGIIITAIFSWHWYFGVSNSQDFIRAYQEYDVLSQAHERSAYTPGAEKNVERQHLNSILAQVLNESIPPKERLSFAEAGLVPLAKVRAEVDDMKEKGKDIEKNIGMLHKKATQVGGLRITDKANEMVAAAEKRNAVIREIETVSYRTNDTVAEIFKGIIKDKGELTSERIRSLNEKIPAAEKDFERLSELYRDLEHIDKKINIAFMEYQNYAG